MPASSPSPTLYTLGRGIVSIGEWSGDTPPGAYTDLGDCPRMEVEVTEEKLEHYSSRSGTRNKDKVVILETGYMVNFDLHEVSITNLRIFLKATLSGSNVLLANTALNKEFAIKFVSDNPAGPNETWEFWKCLLSPGAALSLINESDWTTMSFTAEGLSDSANNPTSPFFTVTFATTTTTTTT